MKDQNEEIDKRVPKKQGRRQLLRNIKLSKNDPINSDGDSLDPRDRIMGKKSKKSVLRPVSNQIDRFGRIAFNKNKEPSQASLDVDDDEEESKSPLLNNPGKQKKDVDNSDANDDQKRMGGYSSNVPLFKSHGAKSQMNKFAQRVMKKLSNKKQDDDPMQLELVFKQKITKRLDQFKKVLGGGKIVNQSKM